MGGKGKGAGKTQKKPSGSKAPSHNSFELLEEEVEEEGIQKKPEDQQSEKGKEASMEITQEQNEHKIDPLSTMELRRDHDMTLEL